MCVYPTCWCCCWGLVTPGDPGDDCPRPLLQVEQQLAQLTAAHQQHQEAAASSASDHQQQLTAQQQRLAEEEEAHRCCRQQLAEVQGALAEGKEELSSKAARLAEVGVQGGGGG